MQVDAMTIPQPLNKIGELARSVQAAGFSGHAPEPKVDVAAVNPWMLRMAGEVADGVHVHPLGEPGYIATFATESTWDGLADALTDKYSETATRIVLYNALGDPDGVERYGADARRISGA